eukprot:6334733-Karenia_brevis.AAC.1
MRPALVTPYKWTEFDAVSLQFWDDVLVPGDLSIVGGCCAVCSSATCFVSRYTDVKCCHAAREGGACVNVCWACTWFSIREPSRLSDGGT